MRQIDIDSLSQEELIALNHKVVARLRFLHQMRSHSTMPSFRIDERVSFHAAGGAIVFGILTRHDKETITVVTDSGQNWKVASGLPSKVGSATTRKSEPDDGLAQFPNGTASK
jgi:hypothetical protein